MGLWVPHPEHSLARVLSHVYGVGPLTPGFAELLQLNLQLNTDVLNAHQPLGSKVIFIADVHMLRGTSPSDDQMTRMLKLLKQEKAAFEESKRNLEALRSGSAEEAEALNMAMAFNSWAGGVSMVGGAINSLQSQLTGRQLQADLREFANWGQQKAKTMAHRPDLAHHYDARMNDVVKRIQSRLGFMEKFVFNGVSTKEALYHGVPKTARPSPMTIGAAQRIAALARNAKIGGGVLMAVDATLGCHAIMEAEEDKKVETAYREVGGFAASLLTGMAMSLVAFSMVTPAGWVAAVVIVSATNYAASQTGKAVGGQIHNRLGDIFNLKDGRLINQTCKG